MCIKNKLPHQVVILEHKILKKSAECKGSLKILFIYR